VSRAAALAWRLLRAAAGIAATLALLAGLPYGLARLTGSPLPRNWPGWQQVQRFFAAPLSDDAIIRLLADAAWLLWAVFALSLLTELIAVTRGQPAPRLPAIAPVQALAAALVGATMMTALHVPRAGTRSTPPLHAALTSATTVSAPVVPGHTAQLTAAAETAGRAASSGSTAQARPKVYRVREDDDLWDIAQRFLGDPEKWHQIYQLNEGKPQPDGNALTDPDLILPGWVLLIPQPASGHAPAPHPGGPGTGTPGGRTPEPSSRPSGPSPQPSQSAEPTARPSQTSPSPGPSAGRSAPGRGAHPPRVAVRLPSGTLIGIAVAVMVAAALTLAAVQRRRRYRPRPGPPSTLQPDTPPLPEVITALRRAARPPLPAAGPDSGDPDEADPYLDLYETRPGPDADGDGAAAPGTDPDSVTEPGPEHPAWRELPPGMIPVGIRGDGAEAAVDLAALGGFGLAGPGAEPAARAILAALLAQAPPGETGLPAVIIPAADAARLLPGAGPATIPGLAVFGTLDAALGELESLQLTLARLSGADLADDPEDAGPAPGAAGPGVTLIAATEPGSGRRLAGILDAGRRTGIAAVLLGTWPAGVTCQVAADGTVAAVTPPNPDLDGIRLFTLGAAEAAAIAGVLQEAGGTPPASRPAPPASTPGDGQRPQAAERAPRIRYLGAPEAPPSPARLPDPAPDPPASAAAGEQPEPGTPTPPPGNRPVQLALLGPLRITAAGQEVSGGMRKARELLAFLAVHHPDGASGEAISEALWPEADPGRAAGQRNLALRKAREMLRTAAGLTAPLWVLNASGRYRLDPALTGTDLEAFGEALEEARTASGDARLAACRRAVGLYRGELAEGAGYEWAEPYAETARRRALDAWTTIAEILQPSDPDLALSALETALSHDPYNEYLYVRIMRLQAAAGRSEAVRRTLGLLESKLTDLGLTPSSQTRQAAAALLAAAPAPAPAPGHQHPRPAPGARPDGDGQHGQRTG
jgi:DNA-binding SARP family transcriptional activator